MTVPMTQAVKRRALAAAGLALLLRLGLWVRMHDQPSAFLRADSASYLIPAANLVDGHGFSRELAPPFAPEAFRTPGYPFFLAVHKLFTQDERVAAGTQILLDAFTAVAAVDAAALLAPGGPWVWLAAVAYGLEPMTVAHSPLILSETLFTFLLMLSLVALLRAGPGGALHLAAVSGLFLGLATMTRPITLYLWLPMAAALMYCWRKNPRAAAAFALTAALLPALWCARNARLFGSFSLATVPGNNMLFYDAAGVEAAAKGLPVDPVSTELRQRFAREHADVTNPFERERLQSAQARELIGGRWLTLARVHLVTGVKMLLGPGSELLAQELYGDSDAAVPDHVHAVAGRGTLAVLNRRPALWLAAAWQALLFLLVYPLAARGAWLAWKRDRFYAAAFVLPLAYLTLVSTGAWCYYRFRVPLWPLVCALAASALNSTAGSGTRVEKSRTTQ